MNRLRLILVTVVAIALALIAALWGGQGARSAITTTGLSIPKVGTQRDISSTWFCVAATAPVEPAPKHQLFITNNSASAAPVRVSAFGAEGSAGTQMVSVAAFQTYVMDVDSTFAKAGLSAMVESSSGTIAVTHWVFSAEMGDTAPCQRDSASQWYFPSQTSLPGSTATLVLFNPFSSDAGVDVSGAIPDGVRTPTEWAGIVVPAGTTKVINLGERLEQREQFSVSVQARSGRILAETVQTFGAIAIAPSASVKGLRLSRPVSEAKSSWTFSGGFKDAGAAESVVIQNPDSTPVSVSVQVVPYGSASMAPEPFRVDIPGRRFAVLDLTAEGRIPDVGFHSIYIESPRTHPVVAQRRIRLSAESPQPPQEGVLSRPALTQGVTADTGASGSTSRWLITGVMTPSDLTPMAFVHNPSDRPVKIDVTGSDIQTKGVAIAKGLEIAAGDGAVVPLTSSSLSAEAIHSYVVTATGPVTVEHLSRLSGIPDLSIVSAFPIGK